MAIAATFFSLVLGLSDDLSALGRLIQYNDFIRMFSLFGYGMQEDFLIKFDSYIISLFLYIGIFSFLVLFGYFYLIKANFNHYKCTNNVWQKRILIFAIINTLCLIYQFSFQYTAGSYSYKLSFLFLFIGLTFTKKTNKNEVCNSCSTL